MGKKYELELRRPKCVKCGSRLQVSKRQSTKMNQGFIVAYCFNRDKHDNNSVIKYYIKSKLSNKQVEPEANVVIEVEQKTSEYE